MNSTDKYRISPAGKGPLHTLLRWRHKAYTPSGSVHSGGHYLKLIYGILGTCFLIYIALSGSVAEDEPTGYNIAPTDWYWQWLVDREEEDEFFSTDMDEFYVEADFSDAGEEVRACTWGTDRTARNLRRYMGAGAANYLLYGLAASLMAIVWGIGWAMLTEWPVRPFLPLPHRPSALDRSLNRVGISFLEIVDNVPKFLLLLVIFFMWDLSALNFTIGMGFFLMFGIAVLFQERFRAHFSSEQYLYALELGLSPWRIFLVHLLKRQVVPLLMVQLPFMLSAFILWEATLAYFDWMVPGFNSWGQLIQSNMTQDNWSYRIPLVCILFIISALYILGDALRERYAPEGN